MKLINIIVFSSALSDTNHCMNLHNNMNSGYEKNTKLAKCKTLKFER